MSTPAKGTKTMASEALIRKLDRLGLSEEEYREKTTNEIDILEMLELEFVR